MTILDEIAAKTRERVAKCKKEKPLEQLKKQALAMEADTGYPFEKALGGDQISFICEVKKASPSKGVIAREFPYLEIARDYEKGGAGAVSVLTEPYYFQGSDAYLQEIKAKISLPVLRKDFVVDEYMIYEAKVLGADAVLLICAILSDQELRDYFALADRLGLSALVEAHDQEEVARALAAHPEILILDDSSVSITGICIPLLWILITACAIGARCLPLSSLYLRAASAAGRISSVWRNIRSMAY